ncbi:MAG: DEAD/DEAH box helicase, partial [Kiritimatiellae bacterium]|nr:DEAD/DEAH box helicase [Kiritimatiellia bacterium]
MDKPGNITDYLRQIRENAWSSRQLGTEFERFVKRYLKVDPSFASQFSDVWLWSECPFAKGGDVGIDLVARTNFGEYVAIQAKCYQPGTQVDKADVDTFLSASGKQIAPEGKPTYYSSRIIIATNDNWTNHASEAIVDQQIPVTRIGLAQIQNSAIDWEKFFAGVKKTIVKKSVRPHQEAAIKDVVKGFEKHERGQLIMACGTGKTFTSLKIAEAICPENGRVLFLVPSISLLGQSLREWCEQADKPLTPFAVCSDSKVTKDPDDTSLADLGFPATTSSAQLVAYGRKLKKNPPAGLTVVFSTYQSISAVQEAQAAGAFGPFDLIICDEAHRTTGAIFKDKDESEFVRIHDKDFIKGKKRLYMTATPRIYGENAKKKADDEFIELCSMDDESKYGPEFHHLTFSAAVKDDLLTDYKVLILAVDEKDMRDLSLADRDGDGEIDSVDQLAKIVGTWKGLNKRIYKDDAQFLGGDIRPMRSAVAFTSTIAESKAYTGQFNAVIEEHFGEDENLQPVEIRHVDGGMNALYRSRQLQWLREADDTTGCRILSNAKCLSEGVDVPGLDAVIFLSPKNSFVEVVQAIGRVMRKAPGKQLGYVIIPVLIPMGMDASGALSTNKRFKVIWDVLSAIRSHDDAFNALDNKVDIIRVEPPKKKRKKPTGDGIGEGEGEDEGFDEEDPPLTIDTERFNDYKKAIQAKLVKACGEHKYWSVWAAEIAEVVQTQIKRITALLNAKDSPYEEDFAKFHETLKANLNKTVTRDEAIAMLAQQLVSAPVFDALFSDYQFIRNNPISKSLEKLLSRLNENIDGKDRETLEKFYESVRHKASDKTTAAQKQAIVVQLYNNFFNIAFKDTVEKLGIVYTPVPVVDFIVKSVECVLKKHFNCSISDRGVHVLDPFTGTGTFITRLLQSGFIKPKDLLYKYENEIHANEIVLLAYYIAAINIESVFHDAIADGKFHPFDGIVLTDTFQLGEGERDIPGMFEENSARAKKQKKLDIRVIIGNPPYNVSKGTAYPHLEQRIAETYAKGSGAVNKNSLYDSYIKAFRWASDRIKDEGVVAFVTNGGWLDAQAMNGFRNSLVEEFDHIYVFNLRG